MSNTFKALVANMESEEFHISLEDRVLDDLPDGNTVIETKYSSLNYKDGLCLGSGGGLLDKILIKTKDNIDSFLEISLLAIKEKYYVNYLCPPELMLQE